MDLYQLFQAKFNMYVECKSHIKRSINMYDKGIYLDSILNWLH